MSAGVRTMGFPGRYLQGPGALLLLPRLLTELGARRVVLLADGVVRATLQARLDAAWRDAPVLQPTWLDFAGECSAAAIEQLAQQAGECDTVVALGGGKAIDTGKGLAKRRGARLVIAPTIASNDSPTSRLIVLYDAQHRVAGVELLARNPDVVLVDTDVIAAAPVRFLAAGIGDALSKQFESAQCHLAGGKNFFGTRSLPTARLLARRCHETIVEFGVAALAQVRTQQRPDDAVEAVVEAAVLLSGIGFESGGLSLAHALVRGFSPHQVLGRFLHGELVAFGTLVQLVAEGRPAAELEAHARLVHALGLPAELGWFGVEGLDRAELNEIARLTCSAPYIAHLVPAIDAAGVVAALQAADRIGRGLEMAA